MKCTEHESSDIRAGHIRVEDKERSIVLAENLLGESEGSSCRTRWSASATFKRKQLHSPVPRGSVSTEKVILTSYCSSTLLRRATMTSGRLRRSETKSAESPVCSSGAAD